MSDVPLPGRWTTEGLTAERCAELERELRREVPANHVLHGQTVAAIAIGVRTDDVIFRLADGRVAAVHLAWRVETDPQWPATILFDDLAALARSDEWD